MKYREEYLQTGGVHCPSCKSTDIEGAAVEVNEGMAVQEVSCVACDGTWRDTYKLVAVETVDEPQK